MSDELKIRPARCYVKVTYPGEGQKRKRQEEREADSAAEANCADSTSIPETGTHNTSKQKRKHGRPAKA